MKHEFTNHSRINNILLTACGSLFLLLLFILCYYNRFAVDDYFQIDKVVHKGIIGGMMDNYFTNGGRWTSYLLSGLVCSFYKVHAGVILYSFMSFFLFGLAVFIILRKIFRFYGINSMLSSTLNFTLLFVALFFFACQGKGEIWFWVSSTAGYLNSLSAFLLIIALMITSYRNILIWLLLIILSVFSGGAVETFAIIFLAIIIFLFILKYTGKNKLINSIAAEKLAIVMVFMTAAFVISVIASGNTVRAGWLSEPSLVVALKMTLITLKNLFLNKILLTTPFIILFSLPWLVVGQSISTGKNRMPLKKFFMNFILSGVLLIMLICLIVFPTCYLVSDTCPDRALSFVILLIVVFTVSWVILLGYYGIISLDLERYFQKIVLIGIGGFLIYTIITQYSAVSTYATALDNRIEYLKSIDIADPNHIEYVDPLPPSGFLYSAEITKDTAHFKNVHFRMGLFVKYNIALK